VIVRFQKISGEKPDFTNMKQKDKRKINSKIKPKILYTDLPPPPSLPKTPNYSCYIQKKF